MLVFSSFMMANTAFNPDDTHPLEVWTGINFGLAAFMVQMGMKDEAFRVTETVVILKSDGYLGNLWSFK